AWAGFIMIGVEHARIDPSLPGFPAELYDMPYTHSLPGSLAWSLAAAVLSKLALRLDWRTSAIIGAVVFSHWPLHLILHPPDSHRAPPRPSAVARRTQGRARPLERSGARTSGGNGLACSLRGDLDSEPQSAGAHGLAGDQLHRLSGVASDRRDADLA